MILTKEVKIKISKSNIKYWSDKGFNVKLKDIIFVNPLFLQRYSSIKIIAECNVCKKQKNITYKNYMKYIKNNNIYTCCKCNNGKREKTNMEKYGVRNISKSEYSKQKQKQTNLLLYGHEYYFQSDEFKNKLRKKLIEKGYKIYNDDYSNYCKTCESLTSKNKKELFEKWDGYDYYDNEYIKDNFKLNGNHKNYPTIDHKISQLYGFLNNIPPNDISKLENLCITKRYINSQKHSKTEDQFMKKK